jgi:signal transduction histidine kinase
MNDARKTKAQLIEELVAERQKTAHVDVSGVERQLAVERVRAEATAMRGSADIGKVLAALYEGWRDGGLEFQIGCLNIIDAERGLYHTYALAPTLDIDATASQRILVETEAAPGLNLYRSLEVDLEWARQRGWAQPDLTGALWEAPETFPEDLEVCWGTAFPGAEQFVGCAGINVPFAYGGVFAMAPAGHRYTDVEVAIVARFADAVSLGYTRYLDLVAAEERAREAEVDRAAEHIRAEAMAMASSEDLYPLTGTFLTDVRRLGINTPFLSLAFIHNEEIVDYHIAHVNWSSMGLQMREDQRNRFEVLDDHVLIQIHEESQPSGETMPGWNMPESMRMAKLEAFRTKEVARLGFFSVEDVPDDVVERQRRAILNVWTGSESDLERVVQAMGLPRYMAHEVPFSHGVVAFREPDDDDRNIKAVATLAESFSVGYFRFLDFQRLEEQNRALEVANAQVEQASLNKSQFLRRMSHDLRSPMNAIIGYSRLLQRRLSDRMDEREARNLANIETSSGNLLSLINDILDLSRIEAGRIELDVQLVDVRKLAAECGDALESIVKEGVELRRDLSDVGEIQTDPDRLRQVVMNLLGNATKFTDTGRITLSLRSVDGVAVLAIADTGVGIPPEDLPHIFDEFRQVERQGGEQTEGTGLGLAIAKKTVDLLGGTLTAVSEVGVGTIFTVQIGDYDG